MLVPQSIALLSTLVGIFPQQAAPPASPTTQTAPSGTPTARVTPVRMPSDTPPDYPGAVWVSAAPTNYQPANRPVDSPIDMIVIHDIEGTAESAVRWFENPRAKVTSHYVVDSVTGVVYQLVKEHDVAWHAGNHDVNTRAVGIEHEGYAYRPGFYNPVEYEASAKLVRSISTRYNIPRDRTHIIGHAEVPNAAHPGQFGGSGGHTDPGPWWDWDSYMTLVRNDANLTAAPTFPTVLHPGESAAETVTFTNAGDDLWPSPTSSTGAGKASETPTAASQRALGLVYLGTWNPTYAPLSPTSVFYGKGWISPRYIAPVTQDIAPGANAMFAFSLYGPRTFGTVTEQFRLYKLPIAPHPPVAFGPTITATIQVVPWDIAIDTTSPAGAFAAPGWKSETIGASHVFSLEFPKTAVGAAPTLPGARWTATVPIDGLWDVYVRWPASKRATSRAIYTVQSTGGGTSSIASQIVIVNQSQGGGDWYKLGRMPLADKQPITITLTGEGEAAIVVADAVRFVGPFPDPNAPKAGDPALFTAGPRP